MRTFVSKMAHILGLLAVVLVVFGAFNHYLKPEKMQLSETPATYLVACFSSGKVIFNGESVGPTQIDHTGKIIFYSSDMDAEILLTNATCVEMVKK